MHETLFLHRKMIFIGVGLVSFSRFRVVHHVRLEILFHGDYFLAGFFFFAFFIAVLRSGFLEWYMLLGWFVN